MPANTTLSVSHTGSGPVIECAVLPAFDEGDLESVRAAFADVPACALGQAWRKEPESGFLPATVKFSWRADALLMFAELNDVQIVSRATGLNQRMWELGDVLEVFLRPEKQSAYVEFQITPPNHTLQLRFPDTATLRQAQAANHFDDFLLPGRVFHSRTWLEPERQRWFVYAAFPVTVVGGAKEVIPGERWHFSVSRFEDSGAGQAPIPSSTSPHPTPDFHRQSEWGLIQF